MDRKFTFLTELKKYSKIICLLLVFGVASMVGVAQTSRPYSLENDRLQEKQLLLQERAGLVSELDVVKLKADLKSSDEHVRLDAVMGAALFSERTITEQVENLLLTDNFAEIRLQAALTLKIIDDKESISVLISALDDSDRDVQFYSALALASLGEKEKCVVFAENLLQTDNNMWWYCHTIFRDAATSMSISYLIAEMNNPDNNIAVGAAQCLAQMGQSAHAFSFLSRSLNNPNKYIRMAALSGLAYIGDGVSLDLITSKLTDENILVRDRSIRILDDYNIPISNEIRDITRAGTQTYDREAAILYAAKWWDDRNSAYNSYGSDCANFVSQCLREGGLTLTGVDNVETDTKGCITNCNCLHTYLLSIGCTHERRGRNQSITNGYSFAYCQRGDVINYGDRLDGTHILRGCKTETSGVDYYQHAVIVTSDNPPKYNGHTTNRENASVTGAYTYNATWNSKHNNGATFRTADFYHFPSTIPIPPSSESPKPNISWSSSNGQEYIFGDNVTISWDSYPGANGYHLIVKQLSVLPHATDQFNEWGFPLKNTINDYYVYSSQHGDPIITGTSKALNTSLNPKLLSLVIGKYVKIYVEAVWVEGTNVYSMGPDAHAESYFLVKPNIPTLISPKNNLNNGQTFNISWTPTNEPEVKYTCILKKLEAPPCSCNNGVVSDGNDCSTECGTELIRYNLSAPNVPNVPLSTLGATGPYWLKIFISAANPNGYGASNYSEYFRVLGPNGELPNDKLENAQPLCNKKPVIQAEWKNCYRAGNTANIFVKNVDAGDKIKLHCRWLDYGVHCNDCSSGTYFSPNENGTTVPSNPTNFNISVPIPTDKAGKTLKIKAENMTKGCWSEDNVDYYDTKVVYIDVRKKDDKGISYLTACDYTEAFSETNYDSKKRFAYWCGKAANDAYTEGNINNTMDLLGFNTEKLNLPEFSINVLQVLGINVISVSVGMKVFIGEKIINGQQYIMISIRGSSTTSNWLTDFNCVPFKWETVLPSIPDVIWTPTLTNWFHTTPINDNTPEAHGGFCLATNKIWNYIKSSTYYKYMNSKTKFIITGHSMGGAITELLTLKIKEETKAPSTNFISYGFASPPVGDVDLYNLANSYGLCSRIHKIKNQYDIVPSAGLFSYTLSNNVKTITTSWTWDNQIGHQMGYVYLENLKLEALTAE